MDNKGEGNQKLIDDILANALTQQNRDTSCARYARLTSIVLGSLTVIAAFALKVLTDNPTVYQDELSAGTAFVASIALIYLGMKAGNGRTSEAEAEQAEAPGLHQD